MPRRRASQPGVCDTKVAELPIRRNSQESERRGTRGLVFGLVSGHGFSRGIGLLGKLGFSPCGAGKLTAAKASGAATCGTAKGRALIQTSRSPTLQKLTPGSASSIDVSCDLIRGGNEAESTGASLSLKFGQIARLAVLLVLLGSAIAPCLAFGEEAVDDTGQVACHRLDCFGGAKPCAKIPVARTQVAVAAQQ